MAAMMMALRSAAAACTAIGGHQHVAKCPYSACDWPHVSNRQCVCAAAGPAECVSL